MKTFCFTIDDNIRFLKEIARGGAVSLFDHPYTALLKKLHGETGVKIQLNLFMRCEDFSLCEMPGKFKPEWEDCADWLRLSFHSDRENVSPYASAGYGEVFSDCGAVIDEIKRFAGERSAAQTTTVHYCDTTPEGARALADRGYKGLLGLFGAGSEKRTSYGLDEYTADKIRGGSTVKIDGVTYAAIDCIMNLCGKDEMIRRIKELEPREHISVMIHEQYFYCDYPYYQPDFGEKLSAAFALFAAERRKSVFFEDIAE